MDGEERKMEGKGRKGKRGKKGKLEWERKVKEILKIFKRLDND
jgi:hypothetical protein